jgi:hypothetical protein
MDTAMATVRKMMQIYTEQYIAPEVSTIPSLSDEIFIFLDPTKRTVVAELAGEALGGILAFAAAEVVPITIADGAFPELRLFFQGNEAEQYFSGPSHVASPEFTRVIGAGLRVSQIGLTVTNPAGLVTSRALAGHVYIDQSD